jgi:hypothetical protein
MPTEQKQAGTQACEVVTGHAALACPVCGGGLVPLRGQWRCSRCFFALCVGCEVVLGTEPGTRESEG